MTVFLKQTARAQKKLNVYDGQQNIQEFFNYLSSFFSRRNFNSSSNFLEETQKQQLQFRRKEAVDSLIIQSVVLCLRRILASLKL